MSIDPAAAIGQSLFGFQAALIQQGTSLGDYIRANHLDHWLSEQLVACLRLRTTFVTALHQFLAQEGLVNIDRVQMSPVTDPLAHDVEHVPSLMYKGQEYVLTHSMIYSKFLACHNPLIKGIFVDSPNIRLEIESPDRSQRGRYLIDFSQMDVEVRRNQGLTLDDYYDKQERVREVLEEDMRRALDLFERLLVTALTRMVEDNADDLDLLGVAIEVPKQPFPVFDYIPARKKWGKGKVETMLGQETDSCLFWARGLMRENYDLIYPFLQRDGSTIPLSNYESSMIYNYDLCARGIVKATGKKSPPLEILSGAIREWLYEPIVERLMVNRIIQNRPEIENGVIRNIRQLGGYGPFLLIANHTDDEGRPTFPETFGGGIGIERTLYALCRSPQLDRIEQVTCFGKNPDSHQIYLF